MRRKKNSRQRRSVTHGWGAMKKHRGAGHRGGRGNAGSGKRADAKKPSFWGKRYFGKYGFVSKKLQETKAINLRDLQIKLPHYVALKTATEKDGVLILDLGKIGYTKLLATGEVGVKMDITVASCSKRSMDKVTAAGGKVNVAE